MGEGGGCPTSLEVGGALWPSVGASIKLRMGSGVGMVTMPPGSQAAIAQHGAPLLAGAACRLGSWGHVLQGCGPLGAFLEDGDLAGAGLARPL